jgi:hypothetical protein
MPPRKRSEGYRPERVSDLTAINDRKIVDFSSDDEFDRAVMNKLQHLEHTICLLSLPNRPNRSRRPPPTPVQPHSHKKLEVSAAAVRNAHHHLSTISQEKYIPTARSAEVNIGRIRELLSGCGGRGREGGMK